MNDHLPSNGIDRFRGWSLAALYGAMALLSALLAFAAYRFWPALDDGGRSVLWLAVMGSISAVVSGRTCLDFVLTLKRTRSAPTLSMFPFLLMVLTMIAAADLFAGY